MAALIAGAAWFGIGYQPNSSLATSISAPDRPPPPAGALGWLHTTGNRVVDDRGRTVLLRGFNDDALLSAAFQPAPLDATDAELMRRSGFNVVRLPIAWSLLEPSRGRIDRAYLDRIVGTVHMLGAHHLRVILDMHMGIAWGPASEIPSWARVPLIPDLKWFPIQHWQDTLSPSQLAGVGYFWISQDWERDFALAWRAVAGRLRNDPGLAGYDVYNEPHVLPLPPRIFGAEWMWPFYQRIVDAIGSVDPNHLFIVESTLFGGFPTEISHLHAPGLVYSPHFYTGSLIAARGDQAQAIARALAERRSEARRLPAVLWIGELGIDHRQPGAPAWTKTVLDDLDRSGTGWAWWQWRQDGHWGVRTASGSLHMDVLRRLARPYLVAAPAGVRTGTPGDGVRGTLTLEVASSHGGQPALVAWPALTLPPPVVSGACVLSSAWDHAAARITLRLAPGDACQVRISASPAGPPPSSG
ncbi:MAG: glycoside hydrolase family 5 protein [Candidatus Dormibacteraceae bacterium]